MNVTRRDVVVPPVFAGKSKDFVVIEVVFSFSTRVTRFDCQFHVAGKGYKNIQMTIVACWNS